MEYDPRGGRAALRVDTRMGPDCVFYLKGSCLKGGACPFRHDPSRLAEQKQTICLYFNSPTGCFKGEACPFKHIKVMDAPVEARINAALGAVPRMLPASPGPDDFHIELDQHAAQVLPPRAAHAARQHALGRVDAFGGEAQLTNGFGAQRLSQRPSASSTPTAHTRLLPAPQQPAVARQRLEEPDERSQVRSQGPPPPVPQERPEKEPVIKRLSRKDDCDVGPKKGVFARLSGGLVKDAVEERSSAAASAERPRRTTVTSTVRVRQATNTASEVPTKRKVAVIDEGPDADEEGELKQSERTVRVASSRNATRKQTMDGDRQPASSRLGASDNGTARTSQPRGPVSSRLSRPAAGQAPLQAPSEVTVGVNASSGTRTASSARLPARALGMIETDAATPAKTPRSSAPVAKQLSAKLDTPLSDRPQRSTAGTAAKAPPVVKTLQELRMERERNRKQQQPDPKLQPEPKRRRSSPQPSDTNAQSNQVAAPAAKIAPIQRQRSASKPPSEQPPGRRHPAAEPATRTTKAGTPKAAEHADDFDWEADIAEDEAGQDDFGGGQPTDEAVDEAMDEEVVAVDEQTVDLGEDAAGAAAQQDDFAKRMAAFADAFD